MNSLQSVLLDPHTDYNIQDLDVFFQIPQNVLDNHAPRKEKYIRENQKPFLNKRLSKAVIQQTRSRNKFVKNLADENRYIYKKLPNLCESLLRKEKKALLRNSYFVTDGQAILLEDTIKKLNVILFSRRFFYYKRPMELSKNNKLEELILR